MFFLYVLMNEINEWLFKEMFYACPKAFNTP